MSALFLLLAIAVLASAQQQGLNLSAVIQADSDRIEVAPGVIFSAAVYSDMPPRQGLDNPNLIGLYSSTLGQFPVIYRGLWLKLTVFPGGFRRLEGVDFDPTGHLSKDAESGWEQLIEEEGGGFSLIFRAEKLGAHPLRFRVRHRDGRDRYSLLIFTASWTRGGTLPTAMEIMVQREPLSRPLGEAALPYLRGFIPATASRNDAGNNQQRVEVPAQSVSQTVSEPSQSTDITDPLREANAPEFVSPEEPVRFSSGELYVWQSALPASELSRQDQLTRQGHELVEETLRDGKVDSSVSIVHLDPKRWRTFAIVFEDQTRFTAVLRHSRSTSPMKIDVKRVGSNFRAVIYGSIANLNDSLMEITDSQGNLRTVTFTDRRPEGQE